MSDIHRRSPQAPGCQTTMPADSGYTVRTQLLVHELREECDRRTMDLVETEVIWKNRGGLRGPEYARQKAAINKDIGEQLQVLVGSGVDPDPLRLGLTHAFDNILKGYRAPSRSRSRSPSRWQHPLERGQDLAGC